MKYPVLKREKTNWTKEELEEIYKYLYDKSRHIISGLRILTIIKKKFNCNTKDILNAQAPHKTKK